MPLARPDVWGVGEGPWQIQGKVASRPEFIVWKILRSFGWNPRFQKNILGGRRMPGGQVLDFVIEDRWPPVYVTVKSYYHKSVYARRDDVYKQLRAQSLIPGVQIVEIWERQLESPRVARDLIRREIGVRGR